MTETETGKALTANRLSDGDVVFLTRSGNWSLSVDDAALAVEPDATKALEARGREAEEANFVTGAYLLSTRNGVTDECARFTSASAFARWGRRSGRISASRPKAQAAVFLPFTHKGRPCIAMMNSIIAS
jgi:uncharacterized protein DUF2849